MSDSVLYSVTEGVATITLNRPEVMNALDATMITALRYACEQAADDRAARAVVLQGAGTAFLAGGDIAMFHANLRRLPALVREGGSELRHAILALQRAPKPVLASVHGAVAGAGVSLMAAADLAIAAEGTRFTLAYSKIGASPDGGATYFLPRLVGYRKALELMLLAEVFDAQAALAVGLVNWITSPEALLAETERLAQRVAQGPTVAFSETKRLAQQGLDVTLAAQLEEEIEAFARCAGTGDFAEGVSAFVQKRKPQFKGE
ncbi:MAG: enoyl-CoA hydratase-related protein [Betaproteobacteria bacterium]|nr:enoyl-CoA hydratase-related protein [Betaproteobacteria bacterium]MDH3437790.1 enoyl-CoA hydratase-related protein [Betaproteobacteria bacterium]